MGIADALSNGRRSARFLVVPYLLVDAARLARLTSIVNALARGGAVALEVGFPFSDPIADGATLAEASQRALEHGTEFKHLIRAVRTASRLMPVAVMTYANPIHRRGIDSAVHELSDAGASGLIVPDLALEETSRWSSIARSHRVSLALMASPGTPPSRMRVIARSSRGFLYLVSHFGTTGTRSDWSVSELRNPIAMARQANHRLPILVGFGVRSYSQARVARAAGADGVIVGSALEERLARRESLASITRWLAELGDVYRFRNGWTFFGTPSGHKIVCS